MRFWANLIGYQLVWFAVVVSAARGAPIFGIVAASAFCALQLAASHRRSNDVCLLLAALALGTAVDGLLAYSGFIRYASHDTAWPAPLWILALWAAFAMVQNHSLSWLRARPIIAALIGAAGAPLAYLAAQRVGAVSLSSPLANAVCALAIGWAVALALLTTIAGMGMAPARQRDPA